MIFTLPISRLMWRLRSHVPSLPVIWRRGLAENARDQPNFYPSRRLTMPIRAFIRLCLLSVLSLLWSAPGWAAPLQCHTEAVARADKLLKYHRDNDDRAYVEPEVKVLPSIANPANKKQRFLVLEVMGYIYKATYRMRVIYYPLGDQCILMGEEVLQLARL